MNDFIRVLLVYFAVVTTSVRSDYGLIRVYPDQDNQEPTVAGQHLCMMYNPHFHRIPNSIQSAVRLKIADYTPNDGCSDIYNNSVSLSDRAVAVLRGDCMFVEKALLIQEYNGSAALIVTNKSLITPGVNQTSDYDEINITVAVIMDSDFQKLQSLGASVQIAMYAPDPPKADINMIIIFIIALFCITIGGYWSGISRQAIYEKKNMRKPEDKDDDEPESLDISPIFILVFVLLLCGMIVAMYFFYSVLVYVVIVLFTIGSSIGLHCCLLPLWRRVMTFRSRLTCCKQSIYVRDLILFALCVAVVVAWAVMRNARFAWIVQDLLGMAFCINFMVIVRLPNLMICTVMLLLLFCYDIFFVFITPLFTSSGESIMVQVATGGSSGGGSAKEELPIVFKLPHLTPSPYSVCSLPFSLLGFGDVLVPAYGVGMACTYAALIFMKTGQPALLYLVPCTLLTTAAIGFKRKELKMLWKGKTAEELLQKNESVKNTTSDTVPDTKDGPINTGDYDTDENQKLL